MRTLKSKIIGVVSTLVIAFGVFFAVNAKEKESLVAETKTTLQTGYFYRYTSSSTDQY